MSGGIGEEVRAAGARVGDREQIGVYLDIERSGAPAVAAKMSARIAPLPRSQLWRSGSTRWRPSERARGGGGSWDRSRDHACTYAPRHARPREQFGASARP